MKQLIPCLILEVPDCSLGNSILKVCIHPTVTDMLAVEIVMVNEHVVSKEVAVSVILFNLNAIAGGKVFEGDFCSNHLVW